MQNDKQMELDEFEFYMKFAKPLVLNLTDPTERAKAATWLHVLRNSKDLTRIDYLKLLLFVLQRRRLLGMFAESHKLGQPLPPLPQDVNLILLARQFIDNERESGGSGDPQPYAVEVSSDLKEYTVAQSIPNFGTHCFFATSKQPITDWSNAEKGIYPKGPRYFQVNIFESTSPSKRIVTAPPTVHDDSYEENDEESASVHSTDLGAPITDKSLNWLEKVEVENLVIPPGKSPVKGRHWDPFQGQDEIDRRIWEISEDLEETLHPNSRDDGDFDQVMDIINAAGGSCSRSSTRSVESKQTLPPGSPSRRTLNLTQEHRVFTTDPDDNSVLQLYKSTGIKETEMAKFKIYEDSPSPGYNPYLEERDQPSSFEDSRDDLEAGLSETYVIAQCPGSQVPTGEQSGGGQYEFTSWADMNNSYSSVQDDREYSVENQEMEGAYGPIAQSEEPAATGSSPSSCCCKKKAQSSGTPQPTCPGGGASTRSPQGAYAVTPQQAPATRRSRVRTPSSQRRQQQRQLVQEQQVTPCSSNSRVPFIGRAETYPEGDLSWLDESHEDVPFDVDEDPNLREYHRWHFKVSRDPFFKGIGRGYRYLGADEVYDYPNPGFVAIQNIREGRGAPENFMNLAKGIDSWWPNESPHGSRPATPRQEENNYAYGYDEPSPTVTPCQRRQTPSPLAYPSPFLYMTPQSPPPLSRRRRAPGRAPIDYTADPGIRRKLNFDGLDDSEEPLPQYGSFRRDLTQQSTPCRGTPQQATIQMTTPQAPTLRTRRRSVAYNPIQAHAETISGGIPLRRPTQGMTAPTSTPRLRAVSRASGTRRPKLAPRRLNFDEESPPPRLAPRRLIFDEETPPPRLAPRRLIFDEETPTPRLAPRRLIFDEETPPPRLVPRRLIFDEELDREPRRGPRQPVGARKPPCVCAPGSAAPLRTRSPVRAPAERERDRMKVRLRI